MHKREATRQTLYMQSGCWFLTWRACFFVPRPAQLTVKYIDLGIVSAGSRGLTHEAVVLGRRTACTTLVSKQDSSCKQVASMHPSSPAPGSCAQTSGQQRQRSRAGADLPETVIMCELFGCLSLLSSLGARMTLAGLEPAIFGSEDQRLIH